MSMIPKTKHGQNELTHHYFRFNQKDNGGESFTIHTTFTSTGVDFDEENPNAGFFVDQELRLNSYRNSASVNLTGYVLTPQNLREMADKLEAAQEAAKKRLMRITEMAKKVSNPCEEELLNDSPPCTITF